LLYQSPYIEITLIYDTERTILLKYLKILLDTDLKNNFIRKNDYVGNSSIISNIAKNFDI